MIDRLVTNLGDSALILPATLGLAAYLALHRERGLLVAMAAAFGLCIAGLLVGKVTFQTCNLIGEALVLRSPSGHAALSGTFYGALALVAGRGRETWLRSGLLGAAMTLTVLIGLSRITLNAHTTAEVVVGWVLGASCVVLMRAMAGSVGAPLRLHALGYGAVLCLVLLNGRQFSPEPTIRRFAMWISSEGMSCPWERSPARMASAGTGLDRASRKP